MIYGQDFDEYVRDCEDPDWAEEEDMDNADHADFLNDYEADYPPENDWSWGE